MASSVARARLTVPVTGTYGGPIPGRLQTVTSVNKGANSMSAFSGKPLDSRVHELTPGTVLLFVGRLDTKLVDIGIVATDGEVDHFDTSLDGTQNIPELRDKVEAALAAAHDPALYRSHQKNTSWPTCIDLTRDMDRYFRPSSFADVAAAQERKTDRAQRRYDEYAREHRENTANESRLHRAIAIRWCGIGLFAGMVCTWALT